MLSVEEELVQIILDNQVQLKREISAMNNLRKRDSKISTDQKQAILLRRLSQKVQKRYIVQKR